MKLSSRLSDLRAQLRNKASNHLGKQKGSITRPFFIIDYPFFDTDSFRQRNNELISVVLELFNRFLNVCQGGMSLFFGKTFH